MKGGADTPEQIAICLNCPALSCQYGECERIKPQAKGERINKRYWLDGERHTLRQWAERYGVEYEMVRQRIARGMPLREALTRKRRVTNKSKQGFAAFGRTMPLVKWAELLGVTPGNLSMRKRLCGGSMENAIRYFEGKGYVLHAEASGAPSGGGNQSGEV